MRRRLAALVTGSRKWADRVAVFDRLFELLTSGGVSKCLVIHGEAVGADMIADETARGLGMVVLPMPAQWDRDGKAAGPKRNAEMVRVLQALRSCGYECHVLAFPIGESRGTRDCIAKAKAAGFEVTVVEGKS